MTSIDDARFTWEISTRGNVEPWVYLMRYKYKLCVGNKDDQLRLNGYKKYNIID